MTTRTQNVPAPLTSPEIEIYPGGENVASSYPRQLRVMVTSMLNLYISYNVTQIGNDIDYLPRNEEGAQNPTVTVLANGHVSYI